MHSRATTNNFNNILKYTNKSSSNKGQGAVISNFALEKKNEERPFQLQ